MLPDVRVWNEEGLIWEETRAKRGVAPSALEALNVAAHYPGAGDYTMNLKYDSISITDDNRANRKREKAIMSATHASARKGPTQSVQTCKHI